MDISLSVLVEIKISGGGYVGKKTVYSNTHTSNDGEISIDILGNGEAMLEVYIDGSLDSSQSLKL